MQYPKKPYTADRKERKEQRKKAPKASRYQYKSEDNLEAIAWRWFSLYIRLRDSNRQSGWGRCITCDKAVHYKESNAGHCISRAKKAIKYDERSVNLQCVDCNKYHYGRYEVYKTKVDEKWGKGTYADLDSKKNNLVKRDRNSFIALIELYKMKVKHLQKGE